MQASAAPCLPSRRWRQQVSYKLWYLSTKLHGVTFQITVILIRTSEVIILYRCRYCGLLDITRFEFLSAMLLNIQDSVAWHRWTSKYLLGVIDVWGCRTASIVTVTQCTLPWLVNGDWEDNTIRRKLDDPSPVDVVSRSADLKSTDTQYCTGDINTIPRDLVFLYRKPRY